MPLTNPNKVVTEERLSEFYGQILPYMGGMPDVLANKFSKGDLYSTDEKMIGQWVDGRPVYQRSFSITLPTASSNIITTSVDYYTNLDFILSYLLPNINGGNGNSLLITNNYSWTGNFYLNGSKKIVFEVNSGSYLLGKSGILTIQYTKTTDTPISIGSDTDYSTDEKIVGTWIDGKPIWQRSLTLPSDYSLTDSWRAVTGWSDVISAIGIDKMICHTLSVMLPTRVEFRYDTYQFESTSETVNLTTTDAITIWYTKTS